MQVLQQFQSELVYKRSIQQEHSEPEEKDVPVEEQQLYNRLSHEAARTKPEIISHWKRFSHSV